MAAVGEKAVKEENQSKTKPKDEKKEEEYNPFKHYISDEKEQIYQRLYDAKFQQYMKEAETRIAHQLAIAYFRDIYSNLGSLLNEFNGRDIVLLDKDDKSNINSMHLIFTQNCLRHINVTAEEFEDIQLSSSFQTLILSDEVKLSDNIISKVANFVTDGGLVISFNKAISIIDQAFPLHIKYRHGETSTDKLIEIDINDGEERNLFENLEGRKCVRFAHTRRVELTGNPAVTVLLSETAPSPSPLLLKLQSGAGLVFHLLPIGTNEVMELHSKDATQRYLKQVENDPAVSEQTKMAWKTALAASHGDSFYLALSLIPFLEIIFGIIKKYRRGGQQQSYSES